MRHKTRYDTSSLTVLMPRRFEFGPGGGEPTVRCTVIYTVHRKQQYPSRAPSPLSIGTPKAHRSRPKTSRVKYWLPQQSQSIKYPKSKNQIRTIDALIPHAIQAFHSPRNSGRTCSQKPKHPRSRKRHATSQEPGAGPSRWRFLEALHQNTIQTRGTGILHAPPPAQPVSGAPRAEP
jgi:hypothetical protein